VAYGKLFMLPQRKIGYESRSR